MNIELKYGCNPHQKPAWMIEPESSPLQILNGTPGYINLLDAFGAWQLVRELRRAIGKPSAASFKHTSPAGAATAGTFQKSPFISEDNLSAIATAYVRARIGDRMSSYGDAVAISDKADVSLAQVLKREVSDLIIAPDFEPEALDILKRKKKGQYLIIQIDPDYEAPEMDSRDVFGFTLQQKRNTEHITPDHFRNIVTAHQKLPSDDIIETLIVATIALKYTQSNSVCVAYEGQVIGMGAGQQSRIHCTRLACDKADKWFLQYHPRVHDLKFVEGLTLAEKVNSIDQYLLWDRLSEFERRELLTRLKQKPEPLSQEERFEWISQFRGICLSSDAYIPFPDNINRAAQSNVQYIAQTGNSLRDEVVTKAADQQNITMIHTGYRWFLH